MKSLKYDPNTAIKMNKYGIVTVMFSDLPSPKGCLLSGFLEDDRNAKYAIAEAIISFQQWIAYDKIPNEDYSSCQDPHNN